MSRGLSERDVVGVEVSLVEVAVFGESCNEEPQHNHGKNALPYGLGDLVPHLLIQEVDLLQTLQVVQPRRCISKSPHSQVVHVGHNVPIVAECDLITRLQEPVLVFCLTVVARDAQRISEGQTLILQE